ncbi:MAG: type II toxin-antitoxin system VapC family toxin [Alphaproteobacteria bacterium]|nr:type II toxin-antitoxin system VapC family toxin [Alphaproteobacteria bacterium]
MKIAVDTNILVRLLTNDDAAQGAIAATLLREAEAVVVTVPTLCELVWVLSRGYKLPAADLARAIRGLLNSGNVVMDRPAVQAGLDLLDSGGDFADGAMAHEGRQLGAERFISFDRKAVQLLLAAGHSASVAA